VLMECTQPATLYQCGSGTVVKKGRGPVQGYSNNVPIVTGGLYCWSADDNMILTPPPLPPLTPPPLAS